MRYLFSDEWTEKAGQIATALGFDHVCLDRIACVESSGTKTTRVIARIHALGKVMQLGLRQRPFYVIELLSERFEKQSGEDKAKTIIHELMHIPKGFGGGFRHHRPYVSRAEVEKAFKRLLGTGFEL